MMIDVAPCREGLQGQQRKDGLHDLPEQGLSIIGGGEVGTDAVALCF